MSIPQLTDRAGISTEQFASAFRDHPGGVAVITADAGDGPVGLTATSVVSVSADPPLLAFSASAGSSSTPTLLAAESVVVHLLGSGELDIARLCATSGIDRFADASVWSRLPGGEPYFPAARRWLLGRPVQRVEAGSGTLVIVHITDVGGAAGGAADGAAGGVAGGASDTGPLVYHSRRWHRLGEASALVG